MSDLFAPFQSTSGLWVFAIAALTNVACALVGCYLVLRRLSLMGDAIAHAVLPGLVLAFLLSGSLDIVPIAIGAVVMGLCTTFFTQALHQHGRVPADASIGVVFTSLFALGVLLVSRYASGMHIDAACVYEGSLQLVALDTRELAGVAVPRTLLTIGPVVLLNAAVIALLWKELKLSAFDAALSTAMGFSANLLHYLLMAMVAITTVVSFEAVGSILVVAMLIVPAATAHLLCDRLGSMLLVACLLAVAAAIGGHWLAESWNVNSAGAIAVASGAIYAATVLGSPRHGVLTSLARNLHTSLRIVREDVLAMLFRLEELGTEKRLDTASAIAALGGGLFARWAIFSLLRCGSVTRSAGKLALTESGRHAARHLVRSHRLWEAYLVQHLGLPLDHVHEPAHRVEHFLNETMQKQLEAVVDDTARDPHGRDIPKAE